VRGNQAWRVANRRGAAGGCKLAAKLCRETLQPVRRGNLLGHASVELKVRVPMSATGAEPGLEVRRPRARGMVGERSEQRASEGGKRVI